MDALRLEPRAWGSDIRIRHAGPLDYLSTWQAMKDFTASRTAHTADEIWLLQHPPVYTQGIAGKTGTPAAQQWHSRDPDRSRRANYLSRSWANRRLSDAGYAPSQTWSARTGQKNGRRRGRLAPGLSYPRMWVARRLRACMWMAQKSQRWG